MNLYDFHPGDSPLLISIPHAGTEVPEDISRRFTAVGSSLPDTDWYVHLLYDFAKQMGASIIKANYSRYVVDLNRAPDSTSLYAANPTSPVCAAQTFAGEAIYSDGYSPSPAEVQQRVAQYWQPYHARIKEELANIWKRFGIALLWDAHSIASEIPALFPGLLPHFNLGTRADAACPEHVVQALADEVRSSGQFSVAVNGRFKGGYITMHYGWPDDGYYAVQLELAERTYMNESPRGGWDVQRAGAAMQCIERLLARYMRFAGPRS